MFDSLRSCSARFCFARFCQEYYVECFSHCKFSQHCKSIRTKQFYLGTIPLFVNVSIIPKRPVIVLALCFTVHTFMKNFKRKRPRITVKKHRFEYYNTLLQNNMICLIVPKKHGIHFLIS